MKLYFYKGGQKVGVSSRAFDVIEQKELMRAWILNFKLDNKNPMRKFVAPGAMFEIDGQLFDIYSLHQNTGASNATDVTAEHVSYRLNNYILPPMYSFMGTPAQILADMLDKAVDSKGNKASAEFSVGTVATLPTKAFSLGNEQEVTIRSATLGLQAIGVEVSYNNFKIDLPVKIGTETGRTFKFGVDLVSIDRSWAVGDGFTYTVAIATIGRLPGAQPWEMFSLGDNVKVQDDIIGDTIERRIVCYTKCHDNPAKDQITLGAFIRDSATNAVEMKASINTKLTEGQRYNGNRITRTEGFVSESDDGKTKVTMSGADGFQCWAKKSGVYVPVAILDENGLAANRLTTPHDDKVYGEIGQVGGTYGFRLVDEYDKIWFSVYKLVSGGFAINNEEKRILLTSRGGTTITGEDSATITGGGSTIAIEEDSVKFKIGSNTLEFGFRNSSLRLDGLDTFSGNLALADGKTAVVHNGFIVAVVYSP